MQPRIAEVAYISSKTLDELSAKVTEKLNHKDEQWDFFGEFKFINDLYIQTLIRIETKGN